VVIVAAAPRRSRSSNSLDAASVDLPFFIGDVLTFALFSAGSESTRCILGAGIREVKGDLVQLQKLVLEIGTAVLDCLVGE
jgi:hypothetical protein